MSIYIFTDLHGQYRLWHKIKNFATSDDTLYCLGDCNDRGKGGIAILREVMQDPRLKDHMVMGNHEHFLWYNMTHADREYLEIWQMPGNGGEYTFNAWRGLSDEEKYNILEFLHNLPKEITIENKKGESFILNHTGYCPDYAPNYSAEDPYLWDRDQLWKQLKGNDDFFRTDDWKHKYIVHGHTPNIGIDEYMGYFFPGKKDYSKGVIQYCHNHKINLDLGSFSTKQVALFNVDTLDVHYFNDSPGDPAPIRTERLQRC